MLFNSLHFFYFFVVVYGLYLLLTHKWQNRMLLFASYAFYGSWDWRFLSLIFISTLVDYVCGIKIHESQQKERKKIYLLISVVTNLGLLGVFKYFNFFIDSATALLHFLPFDLSVLHLHIVLPVGISFYTFQTMSYAIDIYRSELKPTRNFYDFALFVAFFPQLVAGPIERARQLLPQIANPRTITAVQFQEGVWLTVWGLFQKVFIADNLAKVVDTTFASSAPYNGMMVALALYAFAFQVFCDFAGYSNIARGIAKLMGFELMVNFRLPYFARNPVDFWRRWHISLSTWLRDYLYIPLGGSKHGKFKTYRNVFVTMLLGGLWHGASWTFVVWGIYEALLLIGYKAIKPYAEKVLTFQGSGARTCVKYLSILCMFHCAWFSGIFFRGGAIAQSWDMIHALFQSFVWVPEVLHTGVYILYFSVPLIIIQILQYKHDSLMIYTKWTGNQRLVALIIGFSMIAYVLILGGFATMGGGSEFIYFQF